MENIEKTEIKIITDAYTLLLREKRREELRSDYNNICELLERIRSDFKLLCKATKEIASNTPDDFVSYGAGKDLKIGNLEDDERMAIRLEAPIRDKLFLEKLGIDINAPNRIIQELRDMLTKNTNGKTNN